MRFETSRSSNAVRLGTREWLAEAEAGHPAPVDPLSITEQTRLNVLHRPLLHYDSMVSLSPLLIPSLPSSPPLVSSLPSRRAGI